MAINSYKKTIILTSALLGLHGCVSNGGSPGNNGYNEGVPFDPSLTYPPYYEDPVTEEPVFEDPVNEDPVNEDPVTEEPVLEDPTPIPADPEPVIITQHDRLKIQTWYNNGFTGSGVTVAVLDSGLPDETGVATYDVTGAANYALAWNGLQEVQIEDDSGSPFTGVSGSSIHGDHMAQVIASKEQGIAKDASILHGVISYSGRASQNGIFKGMDWSLNNGAQIVNLSFNYGGFTVVRDGLESQVGVNEQDLKNVFQTIDQKDYVLVQSAGNYAENLSLKVVDNAHFSDAILLNNYTFKDKVLIIGAAYYDQPECTVCLADFSDYPGDRVELQNRFVLAPGENLLQDGGVTVGTSGAAASVSGSLALMKQRWNHLTGPEMSSIVLTTADQTFAGYDVFYHGQGHVDMEAAFSPIGEASVPFEGASYEISSLSASLPYGFESVSYSASFVDAYNRDFETVIETNSAQYMSPVNGAVNQTASYLSNNVKSLDFAPGHSFMFGQNSMDSARIEMGSQMAFLSDSGHLFSGLGELNNQAMGYQFNGSNLNFSLSGSIPLNTGSINDLTGLGFQAKVGTPLLSLKASQYMKDGLKNFDKNEALYSSMIEAGTDLKGFFAKAQWINDVQDGSLFIQNQSVQTQKLLAGYQGQLNDVKFGFSFYQEESDLNLTVNRPVSLEQNGTLTNVKETFTSSRENKGLDISVMAKNFTAMAYANDFNKGAYIGYQGRF
ncbi:MAG: S8 family serine peptidase [Methyloprofundus sp.]|nr:S8 family serine peptidase [Methyloprofundus sp.]